MRAPVIKKKPIDTLKLGKYDSENLLKLIFICSLNIGFINYIEE